MSLKLNNCLQLRDQKPANILWVDFYFTHSEFVKTSIPVYFTKLIYLSVILFLFHRINGLLAR